MKKQAMLNDFFLLGTFHLVLFAFSKELIDFKTFLFELETAQINLT